MRTLVGRLLVTVALLAGALAVAARAAQSDPEAVALAKSTLERMGGREAWNDTQYLRWSFPAGRRLVWDKWTGDVRIEAGERVVLMNVRTKRGRVWDGGREITDPDSLGDALETGYAWWVNDSYWLVMPYKLLDPGVDLHYVGRDDLPDGRAADRIRVTFDEGVGLTPRNKYDVWIARDTGLVAQWSYYADAANAEPNFTLPWAGWERFGKILLATKRGRNWDWQIAAPDSVPPSVFVTP